MFWAWAPWAFGTRTDTATTPWMMQSANGFKALRKSGYRGIFCCHYASVGGALEAYSSHHVCVSVCYSFTRFSAQLLKTRCWKLQYVYNVVFFWITIDQIFDLKHCSQDTAWYAHLCWPSREEQTVHNKLPFTLVGPSVLQARQWSW